MQHPSTPQRPIRYEPASIEEENGNVDKPEADSSVVPTNSNLHTTTSSASCTSSSKNKRGSVARSNSMRQYSVAGTMDRLRSTMVGSTAPTSGRHRHYRLRNAVGQIPAIALIGMFHLMIGIPFGVSYFPIGWRRIDGGNETASVSEEQDWVHGPFPLPGKEALGIRMFLFSTTVAQVVFTFASNFKNPIGLQMVENVPFCHELSAIVIARQGYGLNSLSTLSVMFGLASIVVGLVFYLLGKLQLGRVVYFFPTHVLVGCIGGIGVYIAKTGLEVTIDSNFALRTLWNSRHLLMVVFAFEICLRILEHVTKDAHGKPKYSLLSPIYFCMITPIFYLALWIFRIPVGRAEDAGYFFPSLDDDSCDAAECPSPSVLDSIFHDEHLWDIWRIMDISTVSWRAIFDCIPTLVALTLFSLIHVPINIPAFAISTHTDVDMNNELVAHGYSNFIAGALGGLQNYMAYTQSVVYDKSGGTGKPSGIAVAVLTSLLFIIGPTIASYIPRCMAGTLLLHVGTDLFLEGVFDSYGKFDRLEYGGIWLIVVVMTLFGMDAAMIAGAIAAVSTYAVQSITYLNPIRGSMSAATLRSSFRTRSRKALAILSDTRDRILVIQLQGHLFFGNMAQLTESISKLLEKEAPRVVIMDFALVLSIDSSAAQAITKLRSTMQEKFHINLCIFVTGSSEGFPCEINLSEQLPSVRVPQATNSRSYVDSETHRDMEPDEETPLRGDRFSESHVCESLDDGLIHAENALIAMEDPSLLNDEYSDARPSLANENCSLSEERHVALQYLANICPREAEMCDLEHLFSLFEREVYARGQFLWKQGSKSDSAKLLVRGTLVALLEHEAGTSEKITFGNMIGELGLVQGNMRMSSVQCVSEIAVVYSISKKAFNELVKSSPGVARLMDLILIHYLANRVQHVSNRIFETRCLPV